MSAQLSIPEPETTALVVLPGTAIATIISADKENILGRLEEELRHFKPDVTTEPGRKLIASKGAKVSTAKADLLRLADTLTEEWRKSTKAVVSEKKVVEERMNEMRDNILAPLVEYRSREKRRVEAHEEAINEIVGMAALPDDLTADSIREAIRDIKALPPRVWEEFAEKARQITKNTLDVLDIALAAAVKREADAAELARLQAEEAERARLAAIAAQEARERQIAQEAAEQAKREAEQAAERLRVAAEQKAEAERQASQRREQEAREATERAERQARQAEADKLAAEERAREREAELARKAEEQAIEAVAAEQRRAAAAIAQAEAEAVKRAANTAHKTKINREVLADLMKAVPGLAEGDAIEAVKAIARGLVRHVGVAY